MLSRYRASLRVWTDPVGRLLFRLHLRPNHLTLAGLGVSLLAASAFVAGQTRLAGALLLLAGLFDFFDGSLARVSSQVTPFGAFLDSVIDRYSDLVVLLGIVVLFARTPHARGAVVAMAGLVGSVMVSYTKARAESIGVECTVGMMERPERMICLIAGAMFDLLEPALWVLAVLANLTALQRIAFTWRATRDAALLGALAALSLALAGPASAQPDAGVVEPEWIQALPDLPPAPAPAAASPPAETSESASAPPAPAPAAAAEPPPPPVVEVPSEFEAEREQAVAERAAASARKEPARLVPPAVEQAWARAIEALRDGDPGPAVRELSTERALSSPVGDYLRLVLADAHERRGDLAAARAAVLGLAEKHPDSRLAPTALLEAAVLAARAGDPAGSQAALKRLLSTYPEASEVPEALYLLGRTGEQRGQLEAAALAYRELQVVAPASGWADGAGDRLAELAAAGIPTPGLSERQRLERAERLLRGGVARTASEEAARIATESSDPGIVERALGIAANASARLRQYDLAARTFDLAARRAPASRRTGLRLSQARMLLRAGQSREALKVLASIANSGSEAERAEAAFLRASTLDDLDRHAEAVRAYREIAAKHPNREVAGASLWRLGWLAYLRGDLRGADQAWTRTAEVPGGRAWRLAALYWSARAKEQTSGRAAAEKVYRRVLREAPRSYYGVLAARRVSGDLDADGAPEPGIRLPADPQEAVADDPGFARVDLLRRLGLVEHAVAELEEVVLRSVGDPVRLYGFSNAYVRDERYHLALRILRRHFVPLATTGNPAVPRAFWEMLYPFAWRSAVTEAADRAGVDPFLVAAIVREESSYHPQAVSRAGARGLMQLMPGTAQPMAEVRGLPFRGGDLLDDPEINIQLGTTFLGSLLKQFGDPRVAIAAYNAGPARARQWWQGRRTNDIEAWVELIPFDETRQYVKRVMLSWEEYRRIYGGH